MARKKKKAYPRAVLRVHTADFASVETAFRETCEWKGAASSEFAEHLEISLANPYEFVSGHGFPWSRRLVRTTANHGHE